MWLAYLIIEAGLRMAIAAIMKDFPVLEGLPDPNVVNRSQPERKILHKNLVTHEA
jgi:hypothetical protein